MHAVVVRVTIKDREPAEATLREEIVPRISQAPGFAAGYWMRSQDGSNGLSIVVFESEDAAQAAARQLEEQGVPTDAVSIDSIEVREVVAHA